MHYAEMQIQSEPRVSLSSGEHQPTVSLSQADEYHPRKYRHKIFEQQHLVAGVSTRKNRLLLRKVLQYVESCFQNLRQAI